MHLNHSALWRPVPRAGSEGNQKCIQETLRITSLRRATRLGSKSTWQELSFFKCEWGNALLAPACTKSCWRTAVKAGCVGERCGSATTTKRATERQLVRNNDAARVVGIRVHLPLFGRRFEKMSSPRLHFFLKHSRAYAPSRANAREAKRPWARKTDERQRPALFFAAFTSRRRTSRDRRRDATLDTKICSMQYRNIFR